MTKPYHYIRFRWGKGVDLQCISEDFGRLFSVEMRVRPQDEREISLHKDERDELKVKADTLIAMLSRFRAVLSQKEAAPFTSKDVILRKKILEIYPRNRPSILPMFFSQEPKYEVAKE